MDWDDLRVFLALARARRLGAAARATGQNATTVGRRIRRLEAELQTTLFETGPSGYSLTEAGRALLGRAELIESEALDIARSVSGENELSGPVRISVSEGFGTRVLAPRLADFSRTHPGITIDLIASTGFLDPSRREADLAIMLSRPERGPLLVRRLTDYRLGLYARREGGLAAAVTSPADLLGRPLIGYVPDLIYAPELGYLGEVDPRLTATIRSSSIIAQSELVAAGAGVGILPCFIGDSTAQLERLLAREVAITRTFWLVVHRNARHIARVERFIAWLDQVIASVQPLLLGG